MRKRIIYGCEERGDATSPYLTRYTLLNLGCWQLCLHIFHRSDWTDDLHDHPWDFLSLILWGGYIEETPAGKKRYRPGALLWRPAEHVHRVQLYPWKKASPLEKKYEHTRLHELHYVPRRRAITLVWMGKRRRVWGFWEKAAVGTKRTYIAFTDYFKKYRC